MATTARRIGRIAAASAASAGLLLAGAGPALADDPGTSATQGPITLTPEQATFVCTQRIPKILARIDRVTARINADVATRGSTAWLQARQDRPRAPGRHRRATAPPTRPTRRRSVRCGGRWWPSARSPLGRCPAWCRTRQSVARAGSGPVEPVFGSGKGISAAGCRPAVRRPPFRRYARRRWSGAGR